MVKYFVVTNERITYGNSLKDLCEKITTKGLIVEGVKYPVFGYREEVKLFDIEYDHKNDVWVKHVEEVIIPAHVEDIAGTKGLKPKTPPTFNQNDIRN